MCVFPEGGVSNGRHLLTFKKGAFIANKTVQPIVLDYKYDDFSPAYDIMPFMPLPIFGMCHGWVRVNVKVLPPFTPNEYLYSTHADKGEENW